MWVHKNLQLKTIGVQSKQIWNQNEIVGQKNVDPKIICVHAFEEFEDDAITKADNDIKGEYQSLDVYAD